MTDVAMVPNISMAGLKSASYKNKRSDRTLTRARIRMEKLNHCGESTLKDFKPSCMNHRKGNVVGQPTPVEHSRLTVSDTVSIDELAGKSMELMEHRNSARGYLTALENKSSMHCYLEENSKGTTMKPLPKCTQRRWINW